MLYLSERISWNAKSCCCAKSASVAYKISPFLPVWSNPKLFLSTCFPCMKGALHRMSTKHHLLAGHSSCSGEGVWACGGCQRLWPRAWILHSLQLCHLLTSSDKECGWRRTAQIQSECIVEHGQVLGGNSHSWIFQPLHESKHLSCQAT